jgi:hypothetical protein
MAARKGGCVVVLGHARLLFPGGLVRWMRMGVGDVLGTWIGLPIDPANKIVIVVRSDCLYRWVTLNLPE